MEITVPMEITKMFCVYVSVYLRHRVFWLGPLFVIIKKQKVLFTTFVNCV